MDFKESYVKTIEGLKEHLKGGKPSIFLGSKTSTVIPFDRPREYLKTAHSSLEVVHLVELPKNMELQVQNGISMKLLRRVKKSLILGHFWFYFFLTDIKKIVWRYCNAAKYVLQVI